VEKAVKEMRNRKATGDDDVPGDVLNLLGEGGLKIFTKLRKSIYETEKWPKDFTELASYKMQRPSHSQPYSTYSKDT
jgi:hypothetical protein